MRVLSYKRSLKQYHSEDFVELLILNIFPRLLANLCAYFMHKTIMSQSFAGLFTRIAKND